MQHVIKKKKKKKRSEGYDDLTVLTQSRLLSVDVYPVLLTKYLICCCVFLLGLVDREVL